MPRTVYVNAPTRIDFAGGTLDIHPLYLFFDGGITVNAAINLDAQVWIRERDDNYITIHSLDTGASLESEGPVCDLPMDGKLALITRVLRYYAPEGGFDVTTKLLPPHGSGLGASSALFIALSHAVLAYKDLVRDPECIITISNNLEAQLMGMPAGTQDYYPPTYGGLLAIHHDVEGRWVESLDPNGSLLAELQQYVIVTSTNISHHSGSTNWTYVRNFFDKVPETVKSLRRIKETADDFVDAFHARDIHKIAMLLNEEWENRIGLSEYATMPEIDRMIGAAAKAGAWASKVCGAGGGGCMLTLAPQDQRNQVIAALEETGASYLDATLVTDGVTVEVTES